MKRTKKIIAIVTLLIMVVVMAVGCGNTATSKEPVELYIYNSKGENAEQFQAMCEAFTAETGIPTKAFSIGSGQDHTATLNAEMASENPPAIFSVQGLKELVTWEEGGFVLDFNNASNAEFKALADAIPQGLRLNSDGKANYGVPYNVEGYGYIVDSQMIADLFGADSADALLADLRACGYADFEAFVKAVDAYIKAPSAAKVTVNGKEYTFAAAKAGVAANLNGVFAVMGSQKWSYGDHFVNVALNAAFSGAASAASATDADIDGLTDIFTTYAKALDLKTTYLAGAKGPMVRGADFVSEANTGYDQTIQVFADSKAVFLKQGNWAYGNVEKVNADMAKRLSFIPVKMPMTDSMIKVSGLNATKFNQSIPVFVPNFYAINAKVSEQLQDEAMQFLVWLNTSATGNKFVTEDFAFIPYNADPATVTLPNSLGNSIVSYMKDGNTLSAPYHGMPGNWSGDTFGLKIMESYMTKPVWSEQDYADIAAYGISSLKETRAAQE